MLILTLRFFHIIFMAAWLGSLFFIAGDVKRTLAAPDGSGPLLAERVRRYNRVSMISAWLTLFSGVGLIFSLGGFGSVPFPIHISLVTVTLMIIIGAAVIGRSVKQLVTGLGEGAERSTLAPLGKRIAMGVGMTHGLWMVTLVLMVFRTQF